MKSFDYYLQKQRIAAVRPWIVPGATVLDIGSADGALFEALGSHIARGIGIDPDVPAEMTIGRYTLMPGMVPDTDLPAAAFDCITMLAVLEHIPHASQQALVEYCYGRLKDGGRVVITVPSPLVDYILVCLRWLRIIDAMSLEQHYGYHPGQTPVLFGAPYFRMLQHKRFQLGLNNLYVFEKVAAGTIPS